MEASTEMRTYELSFIGRTKGAIGIVYPIRIQVLATGEEEAKLKVYDAHDPHSPVQVRLVEAK